MKHTKKSIFSLWLLSLFVTYQVSISMFTHVHYINGVMVVHSHPFHGKHSHQSSATVCLDRLSAFQTLEIGSFFNLAPERRMLYVLGATREVPSIATIHWSATALRAPPTPVLG